MKRTSIGYGMIALAVVIVVADVVDSIGLAGALYVVGGTALLSSLFLGGFYLIHPNG